MLSKEIQKKILKYYLIINYVYLLLFKILQISHWRVVYLFVLRPVKIHNRRSINPYNLKK